MKNFEKYYNEIKRRIKTKESADTDCLVYKLRTGKNTCEGKACYDCCIENIEWLNENYKKSILTAEEKNKIKLICNFINSFEDRVIYISKKVIISKANYYIAVYYKSNFTDYNLVMCTPYFKGDKFKGMELNKEYTLEELGIELGE